MYNVQKLFFNSHRAALECRSKNKLFNNFLYRKFVKFYNAADTVLACSSNSPNILRLNVKLKKITSLS